MGVINIYIQVNLLILNHFISSLSVYLKTYNNFISLLTIIFNNLKTSWIIV